MPRLPRKIATLRIVELDEDDFEFEVLKAARPVAVYFWAPWCGWCAKFEPVFVQLERAFHGAMKFCKLNVDAHPAIANHYNIKGVPALLFFRDGIELGRIYGYAAPELLREKIEAGLAAREPPKIWASGPAISQHAAGFKEKHAKRAKS